MTTIITKLQQALDLITAGEWDKAHKVVQPIKHPLAYKIHAYLHRQEGDAENAHYWYQRAGVENSDVSLEVELEQLICQLKQKSPT